MYVGSVDDNVYALNATTGAKVWSYTTGNNVNSSPAVSGTVVYVGSYDGKVYAFAGSTPIPEYPIYIFPLVASLTVTMLALRRTRFKSHSPHHSAHAGK